MQETSLQPTEANVDSTSQWQLRLLPLMRGTIIALAIFFFLASLFQLFYLQRQIGNAPHLDFLKESSGFDINEPDTSQLKIYATQQKLLFLLESNTMERRHHEANVFLQSSIWVRYMGFVTGMILAVIGAVFILGKMKESVSEIGGKVQSTEVTIKSASPGIILSTLGTILMVITIVMQHEINVADDAVYLSPMNIVKPPSSSPIKAQSKPTFEIPPGSKDTSKQN